MNHEAIEPAEKKRRKTPSAIIWFAWACAVWIIGDLAAVALPAYQAAQAERTSRATDFACSLLADYHDTKAAWPKSWEDLRQVGGGKSWGENTWPDDEGEVRSRVKIDFDKLLHNAVQAVTPIRGCYDYQDRPGYLRLKSLSEQLSDPEPKPNDLSSEADPQ